MRLNVLLRGQSNAYYFDRLGGSAILKSSLERALGLDGAADGVDLVGAAVPDARGRATAFGGTSFLPDASGIPSWLLAGAGGPGAPLRAGPPELSLLGHVSDLPADVRAAPTAVVWMHDESDSFAAGLTRSEWMDGVRLDAALVRAALGQGPATVPYLFVDVVPFEAGRPGSMQEIKAGMEALAADPAFHGAVAARAGDVDMDNPDNGLPGGRAVFGGPHIDAADAALMAGRISRSLADALAQYARPGSPLEAAGGRLDDAGPRASSASRVPGSPSLLLAGLAMDPASPGMAPLGPGAAAGLGWSVRSGGASVPADSAALLPDGRILLGFPGPVPPGPDAVLHYCYGSGRISAGPSAYAGGGAGSPGRGNAAYDSEGLPAWTPADGVPVSDPPAPAVPPGLLPRVPPLDGIVLAFPPGPSFLGAPGGPDVPGGPGPAGSGAAAAAPPGAPAMGAWDASALVGPVRAGAGGLPPRGAGGSPEMALALGAAAAAPSPAAGPAILPDAAPFLPEAGLPPW